MVQLGIECLLRDEATRFAGVRLGYLANQASVDSSLIHGRIRLKERFGDRLTCLFSPQHGFFGEKQDNMIESDHGRDPHTGLPVYSLYGEHRRPTAEMLETIDVLLVDLVDVGTRVYTFMYTLAYCLEEAKQCNKKVVVLDRPNPIGGMNIEGNILRPEWRSFVGLYPLPMRHGLTIGELARYFNEACNIGADLEVIAMQGWQRDMMFAQTGLPWVLPSPNMPTADTALVYPGQVIWEGTHISEGRGTTKPFEFVGAPYWHHEELLEVLSAVELPGCMLRPTVFEPTSGKWAGQACVGFQLHVTSTADYLPYRTSLALWQAAMQLYPETFRYKEPPYEYEYQRLPMDLIIGDRAIREKIEAGVPVMELEQIWLDDLHHFDRQRRAYFLY